MVIVADSEKSMFARIERMDATLDDFKTITNRRLENLESSKATLEKIATITEMHIDQITKREEKQELREEKQELMMSQLSDTLGKMNTNLDKLNAGQDTLSNGQVELERRMDKYEERGKIDLWDVTKKIGAIILTIVVTYFATTLGLK